MKNRLECMQANKILGGLVDVLPELYYLGTDTE